MFRDRNEITQGDILGMFTIVFFWRGGGSCVLILPVLSPFSLSVFPPIRVSCGGALSQSL